MKWFKHEVTNNNPKIKLLKRKHKAAGYATYFQIVEMIGDALDKTHVDDWFYLPKEYSSNLDLLADEIGVEEKELRTILDTCFEVNLLQSENGRIKCSQLKERADEYTDRLLKKPTKSEKKPTQSDKTVSMSGQGTKSVGTKSGIRIEEDKTRKEREENKSVNVNGDKAFIAILKKLPDIMQDPDYLDYMSSELAEGLKDEHSAAFYRLVAAKCPETKIREILSKIKHDGKAKSPPKVFTSHVERWALSKELGLLPI
jgi:hypothetical protein